MSAVLEQPQFGARLAQGGTHAAFDRSQVLVGARTAHVVEKEAQKEHVPRARRRREHARQRVGGKDARHVGVRRPPKAAPPVSTLRRRALTASYLPRVVARHLCVEQRRRKLVLLTELKEARQHRGIILLVIQHRVQVRVAPKNYAPLVAVKVQMQLLDRGMVPVDGTFLKPPGGLHCSQIAAVLVLLYLVYDPAALHPEHDLVGALGDVLYTIADGTGRISDDFYVNVGVERHENERVVGHNPAVVNFDTATAVRQSATTAVLGRAAPVLRVASLRQHRHLLIPSGVASGAPIFLHARRPRVESTARTVHHFGAHDIV